MEGPGGYQLVGRTVQMYNRYRATRDFKPDKPWLLRFFDQIRFYPVEGAELLSMRAAFALGRIELRVDQETFRLGDYKRFLADNRESIDAFKTRQRAAFDAERNRWIESGQITFSAEVQSETMSESADHEPVHAGHAVRSPVPGSVWKVGVEPGHRVARGDTLVVVESMKMEVKVEAPCSGDVAEVLCAEGRTVAAGQALIVLSPAP
jgi:urea carboxylase